MVYIFLKQKELHQVVLIAAQVFLCNYLKPFLVVFFSCTNLVARVFRHCPYSLHSFSDLEIRAGILYNCSSFFLLISFIYFNLHCRIDTTKFFNWQLTKTFPVLIMVAHFERALHIISLHLFQISVLFFKKIRCQINIDTNYLCYY